MTHPTRKALDAAIAEVDDRDDGEWGWATDLAAAAKDYIAHVEQKRAEQPKGLAQMQDEVTAWCERKGWKGEGSAPVTFGDTMALLHSEVSEALEAFRDWGLEDATYLVANSAHNVAMDSEGGITRKPEGVGSEFADILIRLLDDCDRWGVDLAAEYERKMAYNEKRPYQHGGRTL